MNEIEKAIRAMRNLDEVISITEEEHKSVKLAISALEKQLPKEVNHFLDDDTFITTCCGTDITNEDYTHCPECGQLLGEVNEVPNET